MFHVNQETKQKLYRMFDKTEGSVNEDVKTIKKWLKTQHHLPEVMDECKIRNMLNLCKFNLEKTNEKIDNYYSIRSKYPDLFEESNPRSERLKKAIELTYISNHPHLVDGLHRVTFLKQRQPNSLDPTAVAMLGWAILEMRLQEDFMVDDFGIVDMSNYTLKDISKITFSFLCKIFNIYKAICSLRVHKLYIINSPSYITLLMTFIKLILPAKIFKRVKVYPDAEILKEIFSLEDLPEDYGGNGPSLRELHEVTKKNLAKFQDRFDLLDTMRVDESLRPKK